MNRKYSALFVKHEEVWIAIQSAIYFEAVESIRKLGRKNISEIASEIAQFGAGRAVGILDQALISKRSPALAEQTDGGPRKPRN